VLLVEELPDVQAVVARLNQAVEEVPLGSRLPVL
jgi:hypothetical protein